jgi:hypothetical protein
MTSSQKLAQLRAARVRHFRHGGGSRPDVLVVRHGGGLAVLKDHNACDPGFARLIGPLLAWREGRALERLSGLEGVPRLLARPDARSLLIEYLDAEPAIRRHAPVAWRQYFAALEQLVDRMHARRVAHGDLRSPPNMLVDDSGNPYLVDFVACVFDGRRWNLPARLLFRRFREVDRAGIAKLKSRVAPELLTGEERALLVHKGAFARALRWTGARVRDLSRALLTRRKRGAKHGGTGRSGS